MNLKFIFSDMLQFQISTPKYMEIATIIYPMKHDITKIIKNYLIICFINFSVNFKNNAFDYLSQ